MTNKNIITVLINDFHTIYRGELYQYDYGQKIVFKGVELPEAYEVHFANTSEGESLTVLGDSTGVDIPDELLLSGAPLYFWIYLHETRLDGETVYEGKIDVVERAKPTNTEPTPVQQDTITQTIAALNTAVNHVNFITEHVTETIETSLQEAKDSGEFDGFSPIVDVSKSGKTTSISITDVNGVHTSTVTDGEDAVTPTANVTKQGKTSTITITDVQGTTTAEVYDGASDYEELTHKPQINNVELSGNVSLSDIGVPSKVSELQNDSGYLTAEVDPTVPSWAKQPVKPSYSAQEVGALPSNTFIPANVSDLNNDTGFITSSALPTKVSDLVDDSGHYTKPAGGIPAADLAETYLKAETDPTVPSWAKQPNKPSYTAQEVGALSDNTFIPTNVSDLNNDAGYLVEDDISGKANLADLATVATSGSYNDLLNKPGIPSRVSDLIDDSGHYTKPANGIPATDMTSGVQTSLGLADTAYQKPNNGIPASDLASGVIPSVPVQDVQIKNTSILNNGVANIPLAANGAVGLVQGNNTYGTAITAAGDIMIYRADDSAIKNGNGEYKPIVPYTEHQAVFYGLAKAAGDTTQRESQNNVGIYTSNAQSAIQNMLDVPSTSSVASSIASAVGNVHSFDVEVVQSLPTQNIKEHTIYFVPKTGAANDVYNEYLYINNTWEMIGNTQIDLSGKADKVNSATNGNFAALDSNGNLTDSGHKHSDYLTSHQDITGKADKVSGATSGNFASLDANGNLTDSGHKHSDYLTSHQDISGKLNAPSTAGTAGQILTSDGQGSQSWETLNVQANDWLVRNDLDATVTGKINVLSVPYTIEDIATGKIIYSNGTIQDTSNQCVSPLIPVSAGTYGLKTAHNEYIGNINTGNSYKNGYGFFAADGTTVVSRPTNLLHSLGNDIYVFDVPSDAAYVRFCYGASGPTYYEQALGFFNQWVLLPNADDNIDASFFVVQQKKTNIEIDKLLRLDGSYATLRDTSAREGAAEALARPITFGRKTCAIFEKVCCIGDSYTEGYIFNSSGYAHADNKYSWVEHIKNATGREYVNCGISGATTKSWLTNQNGLAKAQLPENKAQAYIVALQINDAETDLAIGTISDVGTSAETYYGCTSKIIDEIFTINDAAHIFFLTQPKHYTGIHSPYREAELAVIEWYQTAGNGTHQNQVHLIDLLDYWELFQNAGCYDSSVNGHYTGVGWEYTAEIIMYAWSEYINAHPLTFQDVNLIPFARDYGVTDVQFDGTSFVVNGVANIPKAGLNNYGMMMVGNGLEINAQNGKVQTNNAGDTNIKLGVTTNQLITPGRQHLAAFYGLAKAAGDVTQAASDNNVGEYTDAAKLGIQTMLGVAQAPWELIKEVTYTTYDTNYPLEITTDNNSQPFALTDIRLIVQIPSQDNSFTLSNYGLVHCWYGTGNYDYFTFELGAQNISANSTGRMGYGLITQENGLCTVSYAKFTNYGNPISQSLHSNPMDSVAGPFHLYQTPYVFNKIVFSPTTGTIKVSVYGRKNGSAWVANAATWNGGSY